MSTIILVFLNIELTLFFISTSCVKIFGWPQARYKAQLQLFSQCGIHQSMVIIVGILELCGAVTLWFPNYLGVIGIVILSIISIAVIYGRTRFSSWKSSYLMIAILLFLLWILYKKILYISLINGV